MAVVETEAERVCDCAFHDKVCLINHALVAFDRHDSDVHRFSKPVDEYPVDEWYDPKKPWIVLDGSPMRPLALPRRWVGTTPSSHQIVAARVRNKWAIWKWDEDKNAFTIRVVGNPFEVAEALSDLWDD